MNLARLARTVVHLQPGQIINRIVRRAPTPSQLEGPELSRREPKALWTNFTPHPASMLSPTRFKFLAESFELDAGAGWNNPALPRLWTYNLHYFDDLLSSTDEERARWHQSAMARWIRENPPAQGAGWEAYPLSRRTVNWIAAALMGAPLPDGFEKSLTVQARALRRQLEHHLRGNHLFINAKALIFLGCFLDGEEADEFRACGLDLMGKELAEQVLADGAHFERSPMYHALLTEDMLDLVQLGRIYPDVTASWAGTWSSAALAMLKWLGAMTHPDGEIALFNDAAFHEARNHAALVHYARGLGLAPEAATPGSVWLKDSGYIRLVEAPWTVIFDAAPVGPTYIPGHGHADTLSVEISVGSERLVTNGGTSTYQNNALRHVERSTASHATVEIDGQNSSEVWSSFRVGRRARPSDVSLSANGKEARASHDGYRFLTGKPIHQRAISLAGNVLRITDTVHSSSGHHVTARFPLHPSVRVVKTRDNGWLLQTASNRLIEVHVEGSAKCLTVDGQFASEFGIRSPRNVLVWEMTSPLQPTVTNFELISQ
ncbi:alginate lyase family protein [Rhizobium sp. BE258]|uniref:heparinase II/III family protein n=1 Tax=Rhizobium sp. BE258 TaxID=2817722 RepID=UPI0028657A53|nr:alginate lyase family protein [Rhizobium sp. BE258]MDR7142224.1 putative heparinase superfamily protein [Rhizobium sp. BE258]